MPQEIPATRLLDRSVLNDPYPFYRQLQEEAPVWQVPGTSIYVVSSYALLDEAAKRVEDFSSKMVSILYRKINGRPGCFKHGPLGLQVLATADPPMHQQHKAAIFSQLVARRMAQMEPEIQRVAVTHIEKAVETGSIDFMTAIGNPIPITIISQLIGFKDSDPDMLLQAAFDATSIVGGTSNLWQIMMLVRRALRIYGWTTKQLETAEVADGSIISALRLAEKEGTLTHKEAAGVLALLLSAGGESTTSLMGNAVKILAEDEALQQELRANPELVPAFLEEVLRLESPFRFHLRSVPCDTQLGNVGIPAGSIVLMFWSAANRDPSVFENPDHLDLARPRRHMTFGRGIHTCIGAPLARLEAQLVIKTLLERTGNIALDPEHAPQWVNSLQVRRYARLPVKLVPR